MPNNPRCKVPNPARKAAIKARWVEAAKLTCKPFGYDIQERGIQGGIHRTLGSQGRGSRPGSHGSGIPERRLPKPWLPTRLPRKAKVAGMATAKPAFRRRPRPHQAGSSHTQQHQALPTPWGFESRGCRRRMGAAIFRSPHVRISETPASSSTCRSTRRRIGTGISAVSKPRQGKAHECTRPRLQGGLVRGPGTPVRGHPIR
jgi:hypothetical protein